MTRREMVTREQVRYKCMEASMRTKGYMTRALEADTQEAYDDALTLAMKGAQDYKTWTTVLASMIGG